MACIYISIGSNVDKAYYLPRALEALQLHFDDVVHSSVFESEAVGFKGNNFYNSVVGAQTQLPLEQVCVLLKRIEQENGRTPEDKKFSPRTLDLDLLFYDQCVCNTPAQLPRDEITKNAFVLWPLFELAPDLFHPVVKKTIAEIWSDYDKSRQKLWRVEL